MNDSRTSDEPAYNALYNRVYTAAIRRGWNNEDAKERATRAVERQRETDDRWNRACPGELR
jgi:hypothetical protein